VSGEALTTVELEARLAPLVARDWPVDRLLALHRAHTAGVPLLQIAEQLGAKDSTLFCSLRRLLKAGLLALRNPAWPDDLVEQYRTLWREGHSISEIGRRMGITKGAAVGQSHRLIENGTIDARPGGYTGKTPPGERERRRAAALSPAERHARRLETQRKYYASRKATSEPRAPKVAAPKIAPPKIATPKRLTPIALNRPLTAAPRVRVAEQPVVVAPRVGPVVECCWPIGEPGARSFRFCDVPSDPGRPYCKDHVSVAYVKHAPVIREAHP
jgi:GcrA cell cycle regulator